MTQFLLVLRYILPAAYSLLPERMESQAASAFLLAVGLQESGFQHRTQIHGPASSFWQFEVPTVGLLLNHGRVGPILRDVLNSLRYGPLEPIAVHAAMQHNDILAACCARCLLWTNPEALPYQTEAPRAWRVYMDTWRPGKPRPDVWRDNYTVAWGSVVGPPEDTRIA